MAKKVLDKFASILKSDCSTGCDGFPTDRNSATPNQPFYPPFSFCTLQGTVSYDSRGIYFTHRPTPIPDGTYNTVEIVNGCVAGMSFVEAEGYTPPACSGTGEIGGGVSGSVSAKVSPQAGNLTTQRADGLYTVVYAESTDSVVVSGNGTRANPFKFTAKDLTGGGTYNATYSFSDSFNLTADDGFTEVELAEQLKGDDDTRTAAGITFNKFGQAVAIDHDNVPKKLPLITALPPLIYKNEGDVSITFSIDEKQFVSHLTLTGSNDVKVSVQGITTDNGYAGNVSAHIEINEDSFIRKNVNADIQEHEFFLFKTDDPIIGWVDHNEVYLDRDDRGNIRRAWLQNNEIRLNREKCMGKISVSKEGKVTMLTSWQ